MLAWRWANRQFESDSGLLLRGRNLLVKDSANPIGNYPDTDPGSVNSELGTGLRSLKYLVTLGGDRAGALEAVIREADIPNERQCAHLSNHRDWKQALHRGNCRQHFAFAFVRFWPSHN